MMKSLWFKDVKDLYPPCIWADLSENLHHVNGQINTAQVIHLIM